ncbi:MAG: hypothetical protein GY953_47650 [bacterium]|nr:hypothetical protein [bacterium]
MRNALLIFALTAVCLPAQTNLEKARAAYERTNYEGALRHLDGAESAAALALAGQAHYGNADYKKASEELVKAVAAAPRNAHYWHQLGRAWGQRAATSSFLTAPGHAGRCRDAFQKAVELDPEDLDAVSDLFEYYMGAPGFLGGGLDKAAKLAEDARGLDEPQYHYFQAELARKRKEFGQAEQHLRRAVELAPRQVGRVVDLARFLSGRGRHRESDAAFREARALAPDKPKILFEMASALVTEKRNLDQARQLLEQYLESPLTPDDPPRREAEKLLDQVRNK